MRAHTRHAVPRSHQGITMPACTNSQADIQFLNHIPKSCRREDKYGLVSFTFYSMHISPSSSIGVPGNIYILLEPPTLFWKENRWRPWTWKSSVTNPLSQDHVLNFDLRGPVWTYNTGGIVEAPFATLEAAISHFFNNVVETKSQLGSESKPIVID
jgi:hypothetical protein